MKDTLRKILPDFVFKSIQQYRKNNRLKALAGTDVFCVVCNSSFKKFLPHGLNNRSNAKCPNCGALERHRLQLKYLKDKTDLFRENAPIRMLHFAPEKSFRNIFSNLQRLEYVPCDLFPEVYGPGKVPMVKVDITKIPFPDDHFDVILCSHVLEHIPHDRLAMKELYRVMKSDGFGIFQVPLDYGRATTYEDFTIVDPKEREKAFGQYDHVRWYGRDYVDRLRETKFIVKEDDYVKTLSSSEVSRFGFNPSELIYYCRKD